MNTYRGALAALDPSLEARIGMGICRGMAIVGGFGTESRLTFTALGPSAICAEHLAESGAKLSICEEFAEHWSHPQIPEAPWIAIEKHWKAEA